MVKALILSLLLLQGPGPLWDDDDRQTIPEPKERIVSPAYDFFTGAFIQPMAQIGDMPRNFRKLFGSKKEAENTNPLDETPNSSWYTNRNFIRKMTPEEIERGPNLKPGPAAGEWVVDQCKTGGVSQGLRIKDSAGDVYILKFDPPEFPEMATAADVIGSKFFFAAGYNVPANSIVNFDPASLRIEDGAKCRTGAGAGVPLDQAFLDKFFQTVARRPDGRIRAMASKFLDGKPKGPFAGTGWRNDDPNDVIAHEHRRELRGLKVLASFINHTDVKPLNTLDMYVEEDGRKFLKHYLIDFGAALGSSTLEAKHAEEGHEYLFDTGGILKNVATLGIRHQRDQDRAQPLHPAIGFIQGEYGFEPQNWKPNQPIPAFENMTDRDAYWGAKIVASFTDDQLRALIRAGQYSDPAAERMLFEVLRQRRDRIAEYWFRKAAPLDHFAVYGNSLMFEDLAIRGGYDVSGDTTYTVSVQNNGRSEQLRLAPGETIPLPSSVKPGSSLTIQIARASSGWPEQKISLRLTARNNEYEVTEVHR